ANGPDARFGQCIFQVCTNAQFRHVPVPTLAARRTLIAEATQVIAFFITQIAKAWNVKTGRTTTVVILVFKTFYHRAGTYAEMVIHDVVAQLAAAAAQTVRPDIGSGVHQNPGRVEGGCVQEDN